MGVVNGGMNDKPRVRQEIGQMRTWAIRLLFLGITTVGFLWTRWWLIWGHNCSRDNCFLSIQRNVKIYNLFSLPCIVHGIKMFPSGNISWQCHLFWYRLNSAVRVQTLFSPSIPLHHPSKRRQSDLIGNTLTTQAVLSYQCPNLIWSLIIVVVWLKMTLVGSYIWMLS